MRRAHLLLAVALAGVMGCAAQLWWGNKTTTVRLGMSKRQVQALLGPPKDVMVQELQGMMVETWKYFDRTVTFQNGVVQSWSNQP